MGGMQALQWTAAYPKRVFSALAIACPRAIRRRTSRFMNSAARP